MVALKNKATRCTSRQHAALALIDYSDNGMKHAKEQQNKLQTTLSDSDYGPTVAQIAFVTCHLPLCVIVIFPLN